MIDPRISVTTYCVSRVNWTPQNLSHTLPVIVIDFSLVLLKFLCTQKLCVSKSEKQPNASVPTFGFEVHVSHLWDFQLEFWFCDNKCRRNCQSSALCQSQTPDSCVSSFIPQTKRKAKVLSPELQAFGSAKLQGSTERCSLRGSAVRDLFSVPAFRCVARSHNEHFRCVCFNALISGTSDCAWELRVPLWRTKSVFFINHWEFHSFTEFITSLIYHPENSWTTLGRCWWDCAQHERFEATEDGSL